MGMKKCNGNVSEAKKKWRRCPKLIPVHFGDTYPSAYSLKTLYTRPTLVHSCVGWFFDFVNNQTVLGIWKNQIQITDKFWVLEKKFKSQELLIQVNESLQRIAKFPERTIKFSKWLFDVFKILGTMVVYWN
jgi:hypothetical protein